MKIVTDYNTYISDRLQNQVCITQAERDSIAALESVDEKNRFYLLYIHDDKCSWYGCHKTKSKLRISDFGENITHDFLHTDTLPDGITSAKDSILFLKTDKTSNESQLTDVLKNIFQDVRPMPDSQDIETNGKFCFPKIKLQLSPELSVDLWELVTMKSPLHIFLDKKTLSQKLVESPDAPTIKEILPDTNHDYTIGKARVKVLQKFYISVDGYQNIFLNVTDVNGKCKRTMIYSCAIRHQAPKQAASDTAHETSGVQYSVKLDKDIYDISTNILWFLSEELRMKFYTLFEKIAQKEGKDWIQVYQESVKESSLGNWEAKKKELEDMGEDLIELIDYQYMNNIVKKELKNIMKYWDLNYDEYLDLKYHIGKICKIRNAPFHFKLRLMINDIAGFAYSAMNIVKMLNLKGYDFYVDMHYKISEKIKEARSKSSNTQNNNEIKIR